MEKTLKLYTYTIGENGKTEFSPFPSEKNQIEIASFQYDAKRMGGAPTISATLMHESCLDDVWTQNVCTQFNDEIYILKQIPTSSKSNTDARYKHECDFVSERFILENVYVYDVVNADAKPDRPVSNTSTFTFFGDIREFVERLNQSLKYSKLYDDGTVGSRGYRVYVDTSVESTEGKLVSFTDTTFANALQEAFNQYEIPYYFKGREIHFGDYEQSPDYVFEYGANNSLLSVTKTNANQKLVNRISGVGSSDNVPYYYPNDLPKGILSIETLEDNKLLTKDAITVTDNTKLDSALSPNESIVYGRNSIGNIQLASSH